MSPTNGLTDAADYSTDSVTIDFIPTVGMKLELEYITTRHGYPGEETNDHGYVETTQTGTGVITAVPSRKFEQLPIDCDFDYEVQTQYDMTGATRSVSLADARIHQVNYHAGGDWDADTFELTGITVTGYE